MGHVEFREPSQADAGVTRHFSVAVFVVHAGHVALHPHRKLGLWLPPGGHIEMHELPDDAARREAWEETGIAVRLVGSPGIEHDEPGAPRQLLRPEGVQVEDISHDPPHQHIDLIYFAVPEDTALAGLGPGGLPVIGARAGGDEGMQWVDETGLDAHPLTDEVRVWARLALAEVPRRIPGP